LAATLPTAVTFPLPSIFSSRRRQRRRQQHHHLSTM
jgi:hypothetical protein